MSQRTRDKAISGAKWTSIYQLGRLGISFIISIFLARILNPEEFGIVGMLTIFTSLAAVLINSGFSSALVRFKDTNAKDFSTVFYFNLIISVGLYCILFVCAPFIAGFYGQPILISVTRLIGLVFLINALGIVQNAILVRKVDFKTQTIANLTGLSFSSCIAILMAYNGYGVYSIVFQAISQAFFTTLMLWIFSNWRPKGFIVKSSLKKLWGFSSKILATSLITQTLNEFDNMVIGKLFNPYRLGLYGRGKSTSLLPEGILSGVLSAVSFSVLADINDDIDKVRSAHLRFYKLTLFLALPIIIGLIVTSEAFIEVVYSAKWLPAVPFVQLVSIFAIPNILGVLFSQTVMAVGSADIYLKLNTYKKLLTLLAIPFGFLGIYPFVIALVVLKVLSLVFDFYYMHKILAVSYTSYLSKMSKPLIVSLLMGSAVISLKIFLNLEAKQMLLTQFTIGVFLYTLLSFLINKEDFDYLKSIVYEKLKRS